MLTSISSTRVTFLLSLVLSTIVSDSPALLVSASPVPEPQPNPSFDPNPIEIRAFNNRIRPALPSSTPRPYTPPFHVYSSSHNSSFVALPPMMNPNPPIYYTNPSFERSRSGTDADSPNGPNARNRTDETRSGKRSLPAITHVDRDTGMFYDELGRVRIFRGMAISYKIAPFLPITNAFHPVSSFAEDDTRLFDKLNLNIIRLGISWAAVQPRRGPDGFDLNYLAKIKELVTAWEAAGLYVIIECHQDLFAEKFMGDGAPSWAITRDWNTLPFPMPVRGLARASYDGLMGNNSAPTNMNYTDAWGFNYVADSVTRAFWGLYTNYDGVQDEFVKFWGKLAETFTGMNNVIGYEILNEPFVSARSTLHFPISWLTRDRTDSNYLQPMYDKVEAMIRKHDQRGLIFWEPVCGSGGSLGDGFTKTPGDRPEKSVFSFHSYGPNAIDALTMEAAVAKGVYQAKRLGGGRMLTEFDVEYVKGPRWLLRVFNLADQEKLSWIGWQYKQYARVAGSPPHGTLVDPRTGVYRPGMCKLFSRPYPSAVSGQLESFNFNWTTSELTVETTPPPSGDGEIVISVTEEDAWGWEGSWRLLHVSTESGERIGHKRVEDETELESAEKGVRWWVERAWVEGSKLVKIRLGTDWVGSAEVVVGISGKLKPDNGTKSNATVLNEDNMFDQHWDFNASHPMNTTNTWVDWKPHPL